VIGANEPAPPSEYDAIEAAARELREFGLVPSIRASLELLDLLIEHGMSQLVKVKPEELLLRQGSVRQLQLLRRVFAGEEHADGRM
jgi:hypothetical protein